MKLLFAPALLILACCTHDGANGDSARTTSDTSRTATKSNTETPPKEHFKDGWQNIKEGSRDVASGGASGAKKAGTAIHSVACPIAADVRQNVYYAKDSAGYEKMLSAEKSDVRECFASEANAREKGFTRVR